MGCASSSKVLAGASDKFDSPGEEKKIKHFPSTPSSKYELPSEPEQMPQPLPPPLPPPADAVASKPGEGMNADLGFLTDIGEVRGEFVGDSKPKKVNMYMRQTDKFGSEEYEDEDEGGGLGGAGLGGGSDSQGPTAEGKLEEYKQRLSEKNLGTRKKKVKNGNLVLGSASSLASSAGPGFAATGPTPHADFADDPNLPNLPFLAMGEQGQKRREEEELKKGGALNNCTSLAGEGGGSRREQKEFTDDDLDF